MYGLMSRSDSGIGDGLYRDYVRAIKEAARSLDYIPCRCWCLDLVKPGAEFKGSRIFPGPPLLPPVPHSPCTTPQVHLYLS